jgi:predicted HAD superfamily Cof-like phosphohydrolase
MNRETKQVRAFMVAARQELPPLPITPPLAVRILRAKLMLEEVIETIRKGLGVDYLHDPSTLGLLEHMELIINNRTGRWAEIHPGSIIEIADGCADVKVVTIGTELACGIDGEPVFEEVHRSNMSKFIDCTIREDGKIQKGPSYEKADIATVLDKQSDAQ